MQINEILKANMQSLTQTTTNQPASFNNEEKDSIAYFFMRLQNVYGVARMQSQWPDSESLQLARREYGKKIAKFSREDINKAFDLTHSEKESNNKRFEFPDIDAILGLLTNSGVFTGSGGTLSHRLYKPEELLGVGTKEDRRKVALTEINKLKEMFQ